MMLSFDWIPACAGMTKRAVGIITKETAKEAPNNVISAKAEAGMARAIPTAHVF